MLRTKFADQFWCLFSSLFSALSCVIGKWRKVRIDQTNLTFLSKSKKTWRPELWEHINIAIRRNACLNIEAPKYGPSSDVWTIPPICMDNTSDVWMNRCMVHPYIRGIVYTSVNGPYIGAPMYGCWGMLRWVPTGVFSMYGYIYTLPWIIRFPLCFERCSLSGCRI